MASYQDSVAGTADISGLPSPANPKVSGATMAGKVAASGGAEPKIAPPKENGDQQSEPGTEAAASAAEGGSDPSTSGQSRGGPAGDIYSALASGNPDQSHLNPIAPFDWGKKVEEDLGTAYHATERVADHLGTFLHGTGLDELPKDALQNVSSVYDAAFDPRALHSSIQNIWSQDTAQADVIKFLLSNNRDSAEAVLPTALSIGSNPLNAVGAEGPLAYKAATIVGPQLVSALGSMDPHERTSALAWAGLTATILTGGHFKGGTALKQGLAAAMSKWPEVERQLQDLLRLKSNVNRRTAAGQSQSTEDYLRHYLEKGSFPGNVSIVKAATTDKERATSKVFEDPTTGALSKTDSPKQRRERALKDLDAGGVDELLAKAQAGGIHGKFLNALVKNWKKLDLGYDLERVNPSDLQLGNPLHSLLEIHNAGDEAQTAFAKKAMDSFVGVLEHMRGGFWAHGSDPWRAQLRALAGHNRTGGATDTLFQNWVRHIQPLAGSEGEAITKAIANDADALASLSPQARMVAQQGRVLMNATMHEAKRHGYSKDFTGGYVPFLQRANPFRDGKRSASGKFSPVLTTAPKKHKVEAVGVNEDGHLFARPRYQTPHEANAEQARRREGLISDLTDPTKTLARDLAQSPEAKAIKELAATDPEEAARRAKVLAHDWYGDFETDFSKIMSRWNARTIKATRTHQVLQNLTEVTHMDGRPLAIAVQDGAEAKRLSAVEDYRSVQGGSNVFDKFIFHPEFHPDIDKLVNNPKGLTDIPGLKQLAQIEGKTVGYIMSSPLIHTLNIAGRMSTAALMNPIEMTHYMLRGHALTADDHEIEAMRLRARARSFGFIPDMSGKPIFDQLSGRMDAALGHESQAPEEVEQAQRGLGLRNVPERFAHTHATMNDWFWNWYRDFGVMMFHLEEQAALKHGFAEHDAGIWAAERAKTWVGLANPEDHAHPGLHDAARLAMFAPEWWKSWVKLMVPVYRKTGMSESHAAYAAWQGAKFTASALALQKISGNLLNFYLTSSSPFAMDGHMQSTNLPGNQDRIEATAPWLDAIPGMKDLAPSVDPKKGGRRTFENPLARQTFDTIEAAGLETSYKDWRPEDLRDGLTKVLLSRAAPLVEGTAALGNVDLYRSITQNQGAHVDPSQPFGANPMNLLYAVLMMSPAGSQWAEKMASDAGQAFDRAQGPFGARVPKAMQAMVGDSKTAGERIAFSWLTGVNAPYDRAPRTRGTPISDADYQRFHQAQQTYDAEMQKLSAQTLGGQITPSQWLTEYKAARSKYQQSLGPFATAPQYTGGTDGLVNDWYSLQNQATDPATGEVDNGKLSQLQAKFKREHSSAQWSDLQGQLIKNDKKYPMLGLYHRTLDQYHKWQDGYATKAGMDPSVLRQEIIEYGKLSENRVAQERYLQTHRQISMYEAAKKREWYSSPPGLVYGMFYNSPSVSAYMQAHHLTAHDVIAQEQGAA